MSQVFTSRVSGGCKHSLLVVEDVGLKFIVFDSARVVDVDDLEEWVDVLSLNGDLKFCNQVGHLIDRKMSTLIQIEIVEDLLEEGWVTAGQFEDTALNLTEEVGDSLLGDLRVLFLWYLPGGLHHADEVLVGWGAHTEVSIIVDEFCFGYNSVFVSFGALKVAEEVGEDLVASLASLEELWVHGNIVDSSDIGESDSSLVVLVEHSKGLINHCHTSWRQFIPDLK